MKHHPRLSPKESLAERLFFRCDVCGGDLRKNCCGGFTGIHGMKVEHLMERRV